MKSFALLASFCFALAISACGTPPPDSGTGSVTTRQLANGDTVIAAVTSTKVQSPDYDFGTGGVSVGIDAVNKVTQVGGEMKLIPGMVPAQHYVISAAPVGPTIADIQTAFAAGIPKPIAASVPGADLIEVGVILPQDRFLILRNLGEGGVASYEMLTLHFKAPQG